MTVTGLRDWATSSFGHLHQTLRRREPLKDFGFIADTPLGPLSAAMERLQQPTAHQDILDGGHIYQGMPFAAQTPSYVGFCAFCEQFIIGDKNWTRWHYRTRDPSRRYYPDGISDHVAQYYLDCLREASIIIPGPNGCCGERLSCRIRSVGDIQRLIPEYSLSSCAN